MSEVPREACLTAVRVQIAQAEEKLAVACGILRRNGFPTSADDLSRSVKGLRVWTQQDGFLDYLAKPDAGKAP